MGRYDWSQTSIAATKLLETLENPLHVAIVQNYRRHYLLEMSGRYKEIFVPDMSVAEPEYHFSMQGLNARLRGQEVVDLYAGMHLQVFPENEVLAVHDWGIASECTMHQYSTGAELRAAGVEADDPDGWYIMSYEIAMIWHYTERARMIGEHVYHQLWTIQVEVAPPGEPTKDEIDAELNKLIEAQAPQWRATLLP